MGCVSIMNNTGLLMFCEIIALCFAGRTKSSVGKTRVLSIFIVSPCILKILWVLYRVSQEEWIKLRDSVPYVELYRYNPKHLYPKLNGYGDNGQRSLKLWQLLHTYWLPNTYSNWQEYVVYVMLISVHNIKVTCEWHHHHRHDKKRGLDVLPVP